MRSSSTGASVVPSLRAQSAWASLKTTPAPHSSLNGYSSSYGPREQTSGTSGSSGPGRWWSQTTTATPRAARAGDRLVGREPAVDAQDQRGALVGEQVDGLDRDAVALDEAARQVPADVGAELAQRLDRERRGAHAVDVVVAVHDDPAAVRDRVLDGAQASAIAPSAQRIVQRPLELEERARLGRVGRGRGARAPRR